MPISLKPLDHAGRLAVTAGLLVLFPLLIWHGGRAGFASLLSTYAARTNQPAAADAAVNLSPGDPEVHYIRGAVLETNDELPGAIAEYTRAVSLRRDDYVLWLALAHADELNGQVDQAIAAARQAVTLAPFYAQPHWQLGNILVRARQRDEGFRELRLAAASNPTLLPAIVDLAWQLSGGDVQFVKQAIQPQAPEAYKALAESFRKHDKIEDAIAMFGAAGPEFRLVREQYVNELISAKRFKAAYELWAIGHGAGSGSGLGVIVDPGFEQESNLDEPGFGWRTEKKAAAVSLSLDGATPREGKSSLAIEFKGDADPGTPIITQLVLIEPHTHYQLRFAARAEKLVSGGPPNLLVIDAGSNNVLGQSGVFPEESRNWGDYTIEFTTADSTTAIRIVLRRENCSKPPCPIFGRFWLDNFSLQKL